MVLAPASPSTSRWLIIDEISMVSAKLLAELDVRLRKVVREIGTAELGEDGM